MLKRISITLGALIVITALVSVFAWRLRFVEAPAESIMRRVLGIPVTFDRIDYRLFNRITLTNLTLGTSLKCNSITVYFNPLPLLFAHDKLRALAAIDIESPDITCGPELNGLIQRGSAPAGAHTPALSITCHDGTLRYSGIVVSGLSGKISSGEKTSAKLRMYAAGRAINVSLYKERPDMVKAIAEVVSRDLNAKVLVSMQIGADTAGGTYVIPQFSWKTYHIANASGTFVYAPDKLNVTLEHPAINARLYGINYSTFTVSGHAVLDGLVSGMTGSADVLISKAGEKYSGLLTAANTRWSSSLVSSSTTIKFNNNPQSGDWYLEALLDPSQYRIKCFLNNSGAVKTVFYGPRRSSGEITGVLFSSATSLSFNFPDWPVANMPLVSALYPDIEGHLQLRGSYTPERAEAFLNVYSLSQQRSEPVSWYANLTSSSSGTVVAAMSKYNDWQCNARRDTGGGWDINAVFSNAKLPLYLRFFDQTLRPEGILSGTASYSTASGNGECRLSIKDFKNGGFFASEIRAKAAIDSNTISIKEGAVFCKDGTLTASGVIGRSKEAQEGTVSVIAHHFQLADNVSFSGNFTLNGAFDPDKAIYSGRISGNNVGINNISALKLDSHFSCSSRALAIDSFTLSPYARGNAIVNFSKPVKVAGKLTVSKFPLQSLYGPLKGPVSGELNINGSPGSWSADVVALAPALTYKKTVFAANLHSHAREGRLYLDALSLQSGRQSAQLTGLVMPTVKLTGTVSNTEVKTLGALVDGFPESAGGTISATVAVTGTLDEPAVLLSLAGKDVFYDKLHATNVAGIAGYTSGLITISTITVHIADSEFLVVGSTIDLKQSLFNITTVAKNTHAGPFDLFGKFRWAGGWKTDDHGKPSAAVVVSGRDLWINQYSLPAAQIDMRYRDGAVTFAPMSGQPLQVSGVLDLNEAPQITLRNFVMTQPADNATLSAAGEAGPGKWDFTINAVNIPAGATADMFNSPAQMDGLITGTVVASGTMASPQLESSLNLVNGSIAGIPCDNFNLQVSVRRDTATITRARWVKEGMYTVVANGYMPFALTSAAYKRVYRNPMDVTISIEEGSLGFLTSVFSDIKSAKGSLHSQLRLAGTLHRPVTNGYVKIENGEIESKDYISHISQLTANCIWRNNLLTFSNCHAAIGGGNLALGGSVKFDGIIPAFYDLSLKTTGKKGIPLSIPELPIPSPLIKTGIMSSLSRGEPQIALKLSGPAAAPSLSGYALLDNTNFTFPSLAPRSDGDNPLSALIDNLKWDFEFRSGKNTWFENELVHVNIQGAIHLGGVGRHPDVDGKIETTNGSITYLGTEFSVKHALLEIVKNNVALEGQAEAEMSNSQTNLPDVIDVDVSLAPLDKIVPRFSSRNDPSMTQAKALGLVAGADPEKMDNTDQQYYMRSQFIRLFDSTLATPLAKNILRRSGLADTFHVSYQPKANVVTATPGAPTLSELMVGTKYTMGKYLTDKMLFGYSVAFDQIQNKLDLRHALELSYRWTPNLYLKGLYELNSDDNASLPDRRVTVERQWRFGFGGDGKKGK